MTTTKRKSVAESRLRKWEARNLIERFRFKRGMTVKLSPAAIAAGCTIQAIGSDTAVIRAVDITTGMLKVQIHGQAGAVEHPPEFWQPTGAPLQEPKQTDPLIESIEEILRDVAKEWGVGTIHYKKLEAHKRLLEANTRRRDG